MAAAANVRIGLEQELLSICSMIKQQLKKVTTFCNAPQRDVCRAFNAPVCTPLGGMCFVELHMNHLLMMLLFVNAGNSWFIDQELAHNVANLHKHCHVLSMLCTSLLFCFDGVNLLQCCNLVKWLTLLT